ncbi:hypothetical protein TUN205_09059 [Pyrenophora tritici-repentis]|nr:hypothetical protein TUN205_09059 [Pyrenophora tritici-repentis]
MKLSMIATTFLMTITPALSFAVPNPQVLPNLALPLDSALGSKTPAVPILQDITAPNSNASVPAVCSGLGNISQ